MKQYLLIPVILALPVSRSYADEENAGQQSRDANFAERYSRCNLIGSFTVDGKDQQPAKPERYEIETVKKLTGNLWTFTVRIKYGTLDTKLPITVPVAWAGDTPMVSLTDATLPGLGNAFSARVVFHENRYAGTWQHGDKGGHMFGRIEKMAPEETQTAPKKQTDTSS